MPVACRVCRILNPYYYRSYVYRQACRIVSSVKEAYPSTKLWLCCSSSHVSCLVQPSTGLLVHGTILSAASCTTSAVIFLVSCRPFNRFQAYPSMKPLSAWVVDLVYRIDTIRAWIEKGTPAVFWISGFYFPQVNMTKP